MTRLVDSFGPETSVPEPFFTPEDAAARRIWAVGPLMQAIADALSVRFNPVAVRGEISGFSRAASGHCYFSLKDESGQLRCAMFRRAADQLQFAPRDGLLVQATGKLDVYGPRGDLQLIVDALKPAGQGALFEQFLRLKAQLDAEGLFEADRKRGLPPLPRSIAVITSLGAAALRDVVTALRRRVPHIPVLIHPASVQGAQAPRELCQALERAYQRFQDTGEGEVLLLVRGGGSLEDLWAFNDESVVRAVARAPMPVICGVGHETDFTLSDFVADLRAPTPTAAAELCAPTRQSGLDGLTQLKADLTDATWRALDLRTQHLDRIAQRLGRPSGRLHESRQGLLALQHRLAGAVQLRRQRQALMLERLSEAMPLALARSMDSCRQRLDRSGAALALLDPSLVLERGYAFLSDDRGTTITRVGQVAPGQSVKATLADGSLDLTVDR
jgi:exodeoxyribonuclease VII large subunit